MPRRRPGVSESTEYSARSYSYSSIVEPPSIGWHPTTSQILGVSRPPISRSHPTMPATWTRSQVSRSALTHLNACRYQGSMVFYAKPLLLLRRRFQPATTASASHFKEFLPCVKKRALTFATAEKGLLMKFLVLASSSLVD